MGFVFAFNAFETVLWTVIGLVLLGRSSQADSRIRTVVAGITFLLFAISEVIEMQTGAWWRPIWLLLLKAVCIVTLVCIAVIHFRAVKASKERNRAPGNDPPD